MTGCLKEKAFLWKTFSNLWWTDGAESLTRYQKKRLTWETVSHSSMVLVGPTVCTELGWVWQCQRHCSSGTVRRKCVKRGCIHRKVNREWPSHEWRTVCIWDSLRSHHSGHIWKCSEPQMTLCTVYHWSWPNPWLSLEKTKFQTGQEAPSCVTVLWRHLFCRSLNPSVNKLSSASIHFDIFFLHCSSFVLVLIAWPCFHVGHFFHFGSHV